MLWRTPFPEVQVAQPELALGVDGTHGVHRQDGMSDPRQEIADLESEIDALTHVADRCRKAIVLSKAVTGAGALLLVFILTDLVRGGPLPLVLAIAAALGGIALVGSHQSTSEEIATRIAAQEARRNELIDRLALQTVGGE